MKPTIGRIVYYKTRGSADGVFPPTNFAAIVTAICDGEASIAANEDCVSLCTFGPSGIRFEAHVAHGINPGQWDWMPFQKDQQARLAPGTPIAVPLANEEGVDAAVPADVPTIS